MEPWALGPADYRGEGPPTLLRAAAVFTLKTNNSLAIVNSLLVHWTCLIGNNT